MPLQKVYFIADSTNKGIGVAKIPKRGDGGLPRIQKGERGAPQDPKRGMEKRVSGDE